MRDEETTMVMMMDRWTELQPQQSGAKGYLHVVTQDSELSFSRAETIAAGVQNIQAVKTRGGGEKGAGRWLLVMRR
jgi:hypothetical protein